MSPADDVAQLLEPHGVAVIGKVDRSSPADAVLAPHIRRWGRAFYLVDSDGGTIGGNRIYSSVEQIEAPIDLAVVDVPAVDVVQTIQRCAARGVRFAIISAGGFSELGDEGSALEAQLVEVGATCGVRILGPNANANCFDTFADPIAPGIGRIGLITQSGHMGRVISQSEAHGVAFSRWIPTGNEADLEAADFVQYFAEEKSTAVIAGYFEGFRNGGSLRAALALAAERRKPVVVLKVGRHGAATRMAASHTAHLTGADDVMNGLFKQYAVVRVNDVDELIETAALHAKLAPEPRGRRVALYGISGGALALMADHAEAEGIEVPLLSPESQRRLHEILPPHLGVDNPVDNGNLYRTGTEDDRRAIFSIIGSDPAVDVLVCALTGLLPGITDDYVSDILASRAKSDIPVVVTWNTWRMDSPAYEALVRSGIPIFRSFRGCFGALRSYFDYQARVADAATRPRVQAAPSPSRGQVMSDQAAAELLSNAGIPLVSERRVIDVDAASRAAVELGFPVVMKASVSGLVHKTDAGLVVTDLDSVAAVTEAFAALSARTRALAGDERSQEIVVQQQERGIAEVIVGIAPDGLLGKAIVLGLGGIYAEVLRDVSIRPLPITRDDVREMFGELRAYPLLNGARGGAVADIEALSDLVLRLSELAQDPRHGIIELDLNPVIVKSAGCVAVDYLLVAAE